MTILRSLPGHRIVELRTGSHLHGTDTPDSDTDLKSVLLPSGRDILLGRARPNLNWTGGTEERRNHPGEVDHEAFTLQRFLDLVLEGQPLALEMLFAPDHAMTHPPDPLWREVQALAPRLVSRRATVFLRYARQQAGRFGVKGARAAAARRCLSVLEAGEERHGADAPLAMLVAELTCLAADTPHVALVDLPVGGGGVSRHLDLCGRRAPFQAALGVARTMAARVLAGYGQRALAAERQGGTDWKALSHAVRVGQEAVELLDTGRLHFPLAGAGYLRDIKLGLVDLPTVEAEIDALVDAVERAAAASVLPEAPDSKAAEALLLRAHRRQVLEEP